MELTPEERQALARAKAAATDPEDAKALGKVLARANRSAAALKAHARKRAFRARTAVISCPDDPYVERQSEMMADHAAFQFNEFNCD